VRLLDLAVLVRLAGVVGRRLHAIVAQQRRIALGPGLEPFGQHLERL